MGIQYETYQQENGEDFSNVFAIFIGMINFIPNNILFWGIKFRETAGSPGISSTPVISIDFF